MRRQQREQPQTGQRAFVAFEPRVNQQAGMVRIGDDLLDDPIAALFARAGHAKAQRDVGKLLDRGGQVPPLVVEERLAVGDQVLQVANLRPVDRRVIDLADDAGGQREPDAAGGRIGGADRLLVAARPARLDAGRSEGVLPACFCMKGGIALTGLRADVSTSLACREIQGKTGRKVGHSGRISPLTNPTRKRGNFPTFRIEAIPRRRLSKFLDSEIPR